MSPTTYAPAGPAAGSLAPRDFLPPGGDRLLTEAQTAELLGLAPSTLRRRRSTGDPNQPDHVKIGRSVRYRLSSVIAFVNSLQTSGGAR